MKTISFSVESVGPGTPEAEAEMDEKVEQLFDRIEAEVEANEEKGLISRVTFTVTIETVEKAAP